MCGSSYLKHCGQCGREKVLKYTSAASGAVQWIMYCVMSSPEDSSGDLRQTGHSLTECRRGGRSRMLYTLSQLALLEITTFSFDDMLLLVAVNGEGSRPVLTAQAYRLK